MSKRGAYYNNHIPGHKQQDNCQAARKSNTTDKIADSEDGSV